MRIEKYTSKDFKDSIDKSNIIIIPIGSLEAHGDHMPLGTDIFAPRMFCEGVEERIGEKVWIAPEIPYGQSNDLSVYPGTVTVPSTVFAEYLFHVGKSFYDNGLIKIVFMNGHGGNITALNLAAEKLAAIGATVIIINWWMDFLEEILKITETRGHGGEDETSAMLYYDEKLVKMDRVKVNRNKPLFRVYFKDRGKILMKHGITGDPTNATKEKGQKIFDVVKKKIVERIELLIEDKYFETL
ncbi:creatininase family protein [Wukongibacter baidiensis]|uniref:creatininase family protein n=1 Tax=Wukongibacter baidiensis TaxID=1723361 RepID=UPI003D7F25F1